MVTGLPKPAKSSGAGIVGADKAAFWSYGLQKAAEGEERGEAEDQKDKNPGYLAPSSIRASKGYLLALQHLSRSQNHWLPMGPAWLCFWAVQSEEVTNIFARLFRQPDPLIVRKFLTSPWAGLEKPPLDSEKFIAATLTAAGPRIVIKAWVQMPLATASANLKAWFTDLHIDTGSGQPINEQTAEENSFPPLAIKRLAGCTSPLTKKGNRLIPDDEKLRPDVAAQLYHAALEGSAPPVSLLTPILNQLHSKLVRDENYQILYDQSRFALLKLILNRNRKDNDMEIKPQLTAETDDPAYNCGRLLAILAATQDKAHDYKLEGAGVAERYFGTASVSPASVFPLLCRLNRHHLNKIAKSERFGGHERFIEEQIQGVCALFKPAKPGLPPMFPRTLDLQAQGRFALGFYQQMAADAAARQASRKSNDTKTEIENK
jgi:CRISPR-associated protein Csd1